MRKTVALPACVKCGTHHEDLAKRDESCAVLSAEKTIAHLYKNGGTARQLLFAMAERAEALGNEAKASEYRARAEAVR